MISLRNGPRLIVEPHNGAIKTIDNEVFRQSEKKIKLFTTVTQCEICILAIHRFPPPSPLPLSSPSHPLSPFPQIPEEEKREGR